MKAITFTAAAAFAALTLAPTFAAAGNAGASLGACYNHVISACNQTNHPQECANSGMDACDEYHNASIQLDPIDKIKLLKGPGKKYRVILNPRPARFIDPEDDSEDHRGGREKAGR